MKLTHSNTSREEEFSMNIILADDERLPRLGLKSMIEELFPNQHTFIEITNGEELLLYVEQQTPDVIFLDIHMPKLSGLEAFSQFYQKNIPVVMLTGYAEFSYAKEALKYGAIDYLLKPAGLEEIKRVMMQIYQLKKDAHAVYQKNYELECKKILNLFFSIHFIQQPKFVKPPYTAMLFYFDHDPNSSKKNYFDLLSTSLENLSDAYSFPCSCSFLPSGELLFLSSGKIPLTSLNHIPEDFRNSSSCLATGFSCYADSIEELLNTITYIQKMESIRLCTHLGKCIFLTELKQQEFFLPFSSLIDKAIFSLQLNDTMHLQKTLSEIQNLKEGEFLLSKCDTSLSIIFHRLFHHHVSIHSILQLIDSIKHMYSQEKETDIIQKINLYVNQNYMNQIGINTISDLLGISPNYLSKTYKLKTGENFTDYLTKIRMQKAIELIESGSCKTVREIAEKVGYFSTRYFTKLFLKTTGVTPSEYLKQHIPL